MGDGPRQLSVSVLQGSVHVNQVSLERGTDHALVFQADLREKYADIIAYGGSSEGLSVMLHSSEEVSAGEHPTQITFTGDLDGWQVSAEIVRYSLTILLFRPNPAAEVVWQDDEAMAEYTPEELA